MRRSKRVVSVVLSALLAVFSIGGGCQTETPGGGIDDLGGITVTQTDNGSRNGLSVQYDVLDFGASIEELTFEIENSTGSSVAFELLPEAEWVTVDPPNATVAAQPVRVTVRVDRLLMEDGEHSSAIAINVGGAEAFRITVHAQRVSSPDGSILIVSAAALDFGTASHAISIGVRNGGTGTLAYTVSASAPWLSVSGGDGTSTGEIDLISVAVDRTGLSAGSYEGDVQVLSSTQAAVIRVRMEVSEPAPNDGDQAAVLFVSVGELDFGAAQTRLGFAVRNSGAGTLNYTVRSTAAWATPSSAGGANTGDFDVIQISVTRDGLTAGDYVGGVDIEGDNGDTFSVVLRMNVPQGELPPALTVSTNLIDLGMARSETFSVGNAGGGTVNFTVATDATWVTLGAANGSVGSEGQVAIDFTVSAETLPVGDYEATITVSGDEGTTRTIGLMVHVKYSFDGTPFDSESVPYFGYPWTPQEEDLYLTESNYQIFMRPFQSNFWVFWDEQADEYLPAYRLAVPGSVLTRYFSSCLATPVDPPGTIGMKLPNVPDAWLLRNNVGGYFEIYYPQSGSSRVIDLTIPAARQALIEFWRERSAGWDAIFLDNVIYKYSTVYDSNIHGRDAWFAAVYDLLYEARAALDKPIIPNISCRPEEVWDELMPATDGFIFEFALGGMYMQWTPFREFFLREELAVYRRALDNGKIVLLMNNDTWSQVADQHAASMPPVAGPLFSAAICLVKEPGDQIFFNCNANLNRDYALYPFHEWWRKLGRPLGAYRWEGLVVRRDFSRGSVEIDITTPEPQVRVLITKDE
ncbi:MAG: hypothetical protein CHACPFDD_02862 [Phycisphaerae bacterium]|nr:hypothetical protein [Phycisphaerae bacterium]